ncbi:MAG: Ig-like domain-containing protein [Candidatus Zixiibacteriota bacterium]
MKHRLSFLAVICMIVLSFGQANASYMFAEAATVANPDVPVDSIMVGVPFTIDVSMHNNYGEMYGGSMALSFYGSPGINNFTHLNIGGVSPGGFSDNSILGVNGWNGLWTLLNSWIAINWNGNIADTVNWTGATLGSWPPGTVPVKYLKFGFQIDEISANGTFCIDSVSVPNQSPPGKFDWLFDDPNFMFGGPYCWTIYDPSIQPNTAPVVADIPNQTVPEGGTFTTIALDNYVSDAEQTDAEISWTATGQSQLTVSIVNRIATISIPNAEWSGSETITFIASDGDLTDSDAAIFTVTAVNDAPVVGNIPNQTITEGSTFSIINLDNYVSDADNTDAQMIWTYTGNTDLTVTIVNRIATIGIPNVDWNGSETITFTASDGGLTDSDDATFTVTPVNDPPVVSGITGQTINEGESFNPINLDDYVTDIDNSDAEMTWTVYHHTDGDELIVNIVDRVATISVPYSDWIGIDSIEFIASDGQYSATDSGHFRVIAVNDAPVVSDIPGQAVAEGGSFTTINLDDYVNDPDNADAEISWSFSGNTELGVSIVDRVAMITIPDANWNGSETITFTASDGFLTDEDAATFTVWPTNDAPVLDQIATGPVMVDEGSSLTLNLSASDIDGTIPVFSANNMPAANATLTDNFDGTAVFQFNPDFTQAGPYFVTFIATDDSGATDDETVMITVNDVVVTDFQLTAMPTYYEFTIGLDDSIQLDDLVVTEVGEQEVTFWTGNKEGWLFVDTISVTPVMTPETIPVYANSVGMEPGQYIDTIKIYWQNETTDSIMVLVNMTVEAPVTVVHYPDEFMHTVDVGDVIYDTLNIYEMYGRNIPFDFFYGTPSWLTVTAVEPYETPRSMQLVIDAAGLIPGHFYQDTIRIYPVNTGDFDPFAVKVTLIVNEEPTGLAVSPDNFSFTLTQGDHTDVEYLFVYELSGANVPFEIRPAVDDGWLIVDSIQPFITPESAYFVVSAFNLAPGAYGDTLLVISEGYDTIGVPVILYVEEQIQPHVATAPTMFNYTLDQGQMRYDSLYVYETHGMNVPFVFYHMFPWLTVEAFGMPPYNTPYSLSISINTAGLEPGFYADSITIFGDTLGGDNFGLYNMVVVPVFLNVRAVGPTTQDSVWVSTVPGIPGNDVIVPVYFRNFDSLSAINLPLTWSSSALTLNSVSFDGTEVQYVDNKPVTIDNATRRVQIGVIPTFTPNIPASRGLLAKLHFTVDNAVSEAVVKIDTTRLYPSGGLTFVKDGLEIITPTFIFGNVVIDTASGFVCGRVVDTEGNEIEGAMVELWDDFPGGGMMMTEMTDVNGQFACHTTGISPFDAYAYKEGYYPGLVEEIMFGEIGIEIVLSMVPEVTPTLEWIDLYCNNNFFYGVPLPIGSVVDAFTYDGIHCGTYYVDVAGSYGFMPVYRDDEYNVGKDGAMPGDSIKLFINGYPANMSDEVYWTENGDNFEICLDVFTVEDRCIDLAEGWNLISWNVDTPIDHIETIMASIANCIDVVLGFEQGGLTYDPSLVEFSTLWNVDHYSGYWVKLSCPATLCIEGVPVSETTPIHLTKGWNLVSYLPNVVHATPDALASIHDSYLLVALGFDGAAQTYDPLLPGYSTLNEMGPGFGYWLKVSDPVDFSYPGMGPTVSFRQNYARLTASAKMAKIREISTSNIWNDIYSYELVLDGKTVTAGSEVTAVTSDGRIVGAGIVGDGGKFGFIPVYGDNPSTEEIEGLRTGEEYVLAINGIETEESFSFGGPGSRVEINNVTARTGGAMLPNDFALAQNYPNPFNPTTTIKFSLPMAMNTTIEIYNILGEKVATVFDGFGSAGTNTVIWDGNDANGNSVASGIYFYRMTAEDYSNTRKMVLMK